MKSVLTNTQSIYNLNPNSDRYRQCPGCKKEFMAEHKKREFCGDKCKYDYHNHLKELANRAHLHTAFAAQNVQLQQVNEDQKQLDLKKNIELFNSLTMDKQGSCFLLVDLEKLGIKFNAFSLLYKLCNVENSFCVTYGPYSTFLIEPDKLLIHYKKQ